MPPESTQPPTPENTQSMAPTAYPTETPVTPTVTLSTTVVTALPTTPPTEAPTLETVTPIPSPAPTATITPTYTTLSGRVLQLSNCRYGPGAPYLYKYGLVEDSNLEVIGRNDLGTWILVRAIGGNNPCWVKAALMELNGEVMSVAPTYTPLPQSPYYGPLTGVSAVRNGNEVTLSWNAMALRPGDDSEQYPYLVEAWVCQSGKLAFTPVGSYETIVNITDEPGCSEPSHGRVYGVEKHGYTNWVEFSWPGNP